MSEAGRKATAYEERLPGELQTALLQQARPVSDVMARHDSLC